MAFHTDYSRASEGDNLILVMSSMHTRISPVITHQFTYEHVRICQKNNLQYTGKDYRAAFSFLEAKGVPRGLPKPLDIDMKSLRDAEVSLLESGAVAKCPPLPGGDLSREEILNLTIYGCRGGICSPRSTP